jgi:hypothetical protein
VLSLTVRVVGPILDFKMSYGTWLRTGLAAGLMCLIVWALRRAGVPAGGLIAAAIISYVPLLLVLRAVHPREVLSLVMERPAPQP